MAGYELAYVALVVRDADPLLKLLGEDLGLARGEFVADGRVVPVFSLGRSALAVFEPDNPFLDAPRRSGVHHMGLVTDNPAASAETHGLPVLAGESHEIDGVEQVTLDPKATCGIRTRFTAPLKLPASASPTVERIDHLGIASDDNDEAIRVFTDQLGCPVESTQTDLQIHMAIETFTSSKYPAVHHTTPSQVLGGLVSVFTTVGDCELEFLQDYDPAMTPAETRHDVAGNTKGDQSAVAKYVAKYGPGLHHIALKTGDINALLPRLREGGYRMIDTAGRPGGRGSLIGFVHPSNFGGGLVIHFVDREER